MFLAQLHLVDRVQHLRLLAAVDGLAVLVLVGGQIGRRVLVLGIGLSADALLLRLLRRRIASRRAGQVIVQPLFLLVRQLELADELELRCLALAVGQAVVLVDDNWVKIKFNGSTGYVSASFIKKK